MNKDNFLICLAGLPASGKSTFASALKIRFEREILDSKIKIIDPDIIRDSITNGVFDPKKEMIVREQKLKEILDLIAKGYNVIVDDLNYYTSMRHKLKVICDNMGASFFIIYISTPIEICLNWNEKRGQPIPNKIIKDITTKFDYFDKYNWDKPIITIDMSIIKNLETLVDTLVDQIINNIKPSIKQNKKPFKEEESKINYQQKLDKITRDIVGEIIRNSKFHENSKRISKCRKSFVKQHSKSKTDLTKIPDLFKRKIKEILNQ